MQLWAGRLLIFVAVGHLVLALASTLPHLSTVAPDGLVGVVRGPGAPPQLDRQVAFWTSLGSFAGPQMLWGVWVLSAARAGQPTSRATGAALLALTTLQVTLAPVGGFWLNFLPAALLLGAARSARGGRPLARAARGAQ